MNDRRMTYVGQRHVNSLGYLILSDFGRKIHEMNLQKHEQMSEKIIQKKKYIETPFEKDERSASVPQNLGQMEKRRDEKVYECQIILTLYSEQTSSKRILKKTIHRDNFRVRQNSSLTYGIRVVRTSAYVFLFSFDLCPPRIGNSCSRSCFNPPRRQRPNNLPSSQAP